MRNPTSRAYAPGIVQAAVQAVLLAAVTFNALLAIANSHGAPFSYEVVVAAEFAIVAAALALGFIWSREDAIPWYLLIAVTIAVFIGRSLITGEIAPKYARDVLIMPAFVILGMISTERTLDRTAFVVMLIVTAVAVVEAVAPDVYAATFKIPDYYVQTRGARVEDFINSESELFINAVRPDSRIFAFLDVPRISSIFLEPVSLGNYCSIMTAYLCARHTTIGGLRSVLMAMCIAALLIASDGRLATITSLLIVAVAFLAPLLPPYTSMLYLPGGIVVAFALVAVTGAQPSSDDILGRLARTTDLLQRFDAADWAGVSNAHLLQAVDSGVAYLIATQSLLGLIALWLFLVLAGRESTLDQLRYKHAALLYVSLTMLVSYSVFTIKTAALLWFFHGVLQAQPASRRTIHAPYLTQEIAHARARQG